MGAEFTCIILGAAGRDFHDFQTFFRTHPEFRVVCFTADQIPGIDARSFPRELAGPHYDHDIPIHPESKLTDLIREHDLDWVFHAYSDLHHVDVMHKASIVQAAGASFALLGPRHTQLSASVPVLSVTAVRTGAGKSPISQAIARRLADTGLACGVLRHPMPYGDLRRQRVQRFATEADLDTHECTVEEREEYLPYVQQGLTIYAGVDYAAILAAAEADVDMVLWDGGNNDTSFVRADLSIVVVDALRPGHEVSYYPGETNLRLADILVVTKVEQADANELTELLLRIRAVNPTAQIVEAALAFDTDEEAIRGKRVLVVEDGPTSTHGGRPWGAAWLAARKLGAAEIIDPRPYAVGSIAEAYRSYPHMEEILPALGYSDQQRADLAATITACGADVVLDGSPARIGTFLEVAVPIVPVHYRFVQRSGPDLLTLVEAFARTGQ